MYVEGPGFVPQSRVRVSVPGSCLSPGFGHGPEFVPQSPIKLPPYSAVRQ